MCSSCFSDFVFRKTDQQFKRLPFGDDFCEGLWEFLIAAFGMKIINLKVNYHNLMDFSEQISFRFTS